MSGRDESVARFGYTQELRRSLGFLASFGIAFSYVSPVVGVYPLFGFGLAAGWRGAGTARAADQVAGWLTLASVRVVTVPGALIALGRPAARTAPR